MKVEKSVFICSMERAEPNGRSHLNNFSGDLVFMNDIKLNYPVHRRWQTTCCWSFKLHESQTVESTRNASIVIFAFEVKMLCICCQADDIFLNLLLFCLFMCVVLNSQWVKLSRPPLNTLAEPIIILVQGEKNAGLFNVFLKQSQSSWVVLNSGRKIVEGEEISTEIVDQ